MIPVNIAKSFVRNPDLTYAVLGEFAILDRLEPFNCLFTYFLQRTENRIRQHGGSYQHLDRRYCQRRICWATKRYDGFLNALWCTKTTGYCPTINIDGDLPASPFGSFELHHISRFHLGSGTRAICNSSKNATFHVALGIKYLT